MIVSIKKPGEVEFTPIDPRALEDWRRRMMAIFDLADIPVPCPPELEAERDRLLSEVRS